MHNGETEGLGIGVRGAAGGGDEGDAAALEGVGRNGGDADGDDDALHGATGEGASSNGGAAVGEDELIRGAVQEGFLVDGEEGGGEGDDGVQVLYRDAVLLYVGICGAILVAVNSEAAFSKSRCTDGCNVFGNDDALKSRATGEGIITDGNIWRYASCTGQQI